MADAKISALPAATTPLAGTEVIPIVQSSTTKKVASDDLTVKNVRSNATTGILQIAGPTAGQTRVMTTPDANFTAARTDASQTFVSPQTVASGDAQFNLKRDTNVIAAGALNYTNSVNAVAWQIGTNQLVGQGFEINQGNQTNNRLYINPTTYDVRVTSGNLVIGTAGKGIDFSANGGDILGQYDEGIFVTGLTATTSGTVTLDYDKLNYTRIGRTVTLTGEVRVLSVDAPTGIIQLTLPFTSANSTQGRSGRSSLTLGLFFTFDGAPTGSLIGIIEANSNKMTLRTYDNFVQTEITSYLKVGTAMQLCFSYLCQ